MFLGVLGVVVPSSPVLAASFCVRCLLFGARILKSSSWARFLFHSHPFFGFAKPQYCGESSEPRDEQNQLQK